MTWIKLDDQTTDHPKIAGLSDRAFRWWVTGLCYASRFLTDGLLPPTFFMRAPSKVRNELTSAKLWIFDDPNHRIHDYLEHQQSREAVECERRRQRERRKNERGTTDRRTAGTDDGRPDENTRPPIEVEVDTEIRDQKKDQHTHTAHARTNGQSRGANTPGGLPRDHRFHGHCGAKWNICLSEATSLKLMGLWGGPVDDASPAVQEFIDGLELQIGDGPKGDHLWLLQHFDGFMVTKGRTPIPPPVKPKQANGSVSDAIEKWGTE